MYIRTYVRSHCSYFISIPNQSCSSSTFKVVETAKFRIMTKGGMAIPTFLPPKLLSCCVCTYVCIYVQGDTGADGERGMDGVPGEEGLPGSKGQKGDQGIQGADGVMGNMVCIACCKYYACVCTYMHDVQRLKCLYSL